MRQHIFMIGLLAAFVLGSMPLQADAQVRSGPRTVNMTPWFGVPYEHNLRACSRHCTAHGGRWHGGTMRPQECACRREALTLPSRQITWDHHGVKYCLDAEGARYRGKYVTRCQEGKASQIWDIVKVPGVGPHVEYYGGTLVKIQSMVDGKCLGVHNGNLNGLLSGKHPNYGPGVGTMGCTDRGVFWRLYDPGVDGMTMFELEHGAHQINGTLKRYCLSANVLTWNVYARKDCSGSPIRPVYKDFFSSRSKVVVMKRPFVEREQRHVEQWLEAHRSGGSLLLSSCPQVCEQRGLIHTAYSQGRQIGGICGCSKPRTPPIPFWIPASEPQVCNQTCVSSGLVSRGQYSSLGCHCFTSFHEENPFTPFPPCDFLSHHGSHAAHNCRWFSQNFRETLNPTTLKVACKALDSKGKITVELRSCRR